MCSIIHCSILFPEMQALSRGYRCSHVPNHCSRKFCVIDAKVGNRWRFTFSYQEESAPYTYSFFNEHVRWRFEILKLKGVFYISITLFITAEINLKFIKVSGKLTFSETCPLLLTIIYSGVCEICCVLAVRSSWS